MTFLISMVPVLELRGAIPIGVAHGLDYRIAIAVSILGNLVPVPFIVSLHPQDLCLAAHEERAAQRLCHAHGAARA